jgi:hypothetical protein
LALFGMDVNREPLEGDNGDVYGRVAAVADWAGKKDDARYLADFVWSFDSEYVQRCLATHPAGGLPRRRVAT